MLVAAEQTQWADGLNNGVYLLSDDRSKMYGFAKYNSAEFKMFKNPNSIDVRGRKFLILHAIEQETTAKVVVGSKGDKYYVEEGKCSCPGFKFRGTCKHI